MKSLENGLSLLWLCLLFLNNFQVKIFCRCQPLSLIYCVCKVHTPPPFSAGNKTLHVLSFLLFFFGRLWDLEVKNATKTLQKPKLSRVLIKCYGKPYALAGVFVFSLVRPEGPFSDNKQVCCRSVALRRVTCRLYLLCRKGGHQSDPATHPVENNPVL